MNNPKLTNALLIALLALNFILFIGWAVQSMHRHHRHHHHSMSGQFHRDMWHNRSCGFHRGFRGGHRNFGGFNSGSENHFRRHHSNHQW